MKSEIDNKIDKLKKELKVIEQENTFNLAENDSELHSLVNNYRALFEQISYGFLADFLIKIVKQPMEDEDKAKFRLVIFRILDGLDIAKKIKIMSEFSLIKKKLVKKLYEFNQIRVTVDHPNSHQSELESYKEKEKYLEILLLIMEIVDLLQKEILIRNAKQ